MKNTIHIAYESDVKVRRVNGLKYDTIIEIGDGCELFMTEGQLKKLKDQITLTLKSKNN